LAANGSHAATKVANGFRSRSFSGAIRDSFAQIQLGVDPLQARKITSINRLRLGETYRFRGLSAKSN